MRVSIAARRLPSWFELSIRRNSSTAVSIVSGCCGQLAHRVGMAEQQVDAVADQVGGGLVAGVEQEDAVVQQLQLRQPVVLVAARRDLAAGDQRREDFAAVAGRFPLAARHQIAQIILELGDRGDAAVELLLGQHRLQRAEDFQRPVAQRAALVLRDAEQVADQLHRDRGGEVLDQVDRAALGRGVEQAVDQRLDARLHRAQACAA